MAGDRKRSKSTSLSHCGTTLFERTPYCGWQNLINMPIRPRRDPSPLSLRVFTKTNTERLFRHSTIDQGRCSFCGKRLTASAAKPVHASRVFHRMNTAATTTNCYSRQKKKVRKQERFRLRYPRLETLITAIGIGAGALPSLTPLLPEGF
jgi:hypothetical protein